MSEEWIRSNIVIVGETSTGDEVVVLVDSDGVIQTEVE